MKMINIRKATSVDDIQFCSRAILTFRPGIDPGLLIEQSNRMIKDGFELIYIPNEDNTEAAAIAGFRTMEMYRTGKTLYIDDLFTFEDHRGKGYAGALLDHIADLATVKGYKSVHLDSAYHLHPAHRLYLNKGYVLYCQHFAKILG